MNRKHSVNTLIIMREALMIIGIALAVLSLVQQGKTYQAAEATTRSLYECGFPVTVKLDGNFGDWPTNASFGIKPENGKTIGFNIKFNDDDDGGDMDGPYTWLERG